MANNSYLTQKVCTPLCSKNIPHQKYTETNWFWNAQQLRDLGFCFQQLMNNKMPEFSFIASKGRQSFVVKGNGSTKTKQQI